VRATRLWSVGAVLCAALTVAACGKRIEADSVERQIKTGIEQKTKAEVRSVECPEDRPVKKGDVFSCTVTLNNGFKAPAQVTQVDDEGNLRWRIGRG
jgi:hypothetical protein